MQNETTTERIAGLIGPVLMASAATVLLNRKNLPELMASIANDWGLVFLSGAMLLVAGVAIVRVHNLWTGGFTTLVTVLGYATLAIGLARMLYARQLAAMAPSIGDHPTAVLFACLAMLFFGAFLTLKSFRLFD